MKITVIVAELDAERLDGPLDEAIEKLQRIAAQQSADMVENVRIEDVSMDYYPNFHILGEREENAKERAQREAREQKQRDDDTALEYRVYKKLYSRFDGRHPDDV